jgi:tryptophan synthase beta chain
LIGSSGRPGAYPAIVRDLQRVIGDEARAQVLAAEAACRTASSRAVGGGSNAIGTFVPFVDDADVERRRRRGRGAGEGQRSPRRTAHRSAGRRACSTARFSACSRTSGPDPRGALDLAGLDYPARARARVAARHGRARYVAVTTTRRSRRSARHAARGHHPGARDRARAALRARSPRDSTLDLVCLLGPRRQGPRRGPRRSAEHGGRRAIAAAFRGSGSARRSCPT